jgi:hypothetical protein
MAALPSDAVSRLAVERARARMPGLVPESIEVVELVRGRPHVVVHCSPAGVVVLDERGRLVRGRERLLAVARHLDGTRRAYRALEQGLLERRRAHAEESVALLSRQLSRQRRTVLRESVSALLTELEALRERLALLEAEFRRRPGLQPTERTLRRTMAILNEAARTDRRVVLATRRLAAVMAGIDGPTRRLETLRRWVAARLASSDLAFFVPELEEQERSRFVEEFVAAART